MKTQTQPQKTPLVSVGSGDTPPTAADREYFLITRKSLTGALGREGESFFQAASVYSQLSPDNQRCFARLSCELIELWAQGHKGIVVRLEARRGAERLVINPRRDGRITQVYTLAPDCDLSFLGGLISATHRERTIAGNHAILALMSEQERRIWLSRNGIPESAWRDPGGRSNRGGHLPLAQAAKPTRKSRVA